MKNTNSTTEKAEAPAELRASGTVKQGRRPMYVSHEDARKAASSAQFTPGPWGVEFTESRAWIGPMRKDGSKIDRIVCSTEREGLVAESLAEKDANARLIAAAPDLLATLRQIQEVCEHRYLTTGNIEIRGLIDLAIAKAEGRA